jgi:hypothetical protein
VEGQPLSDRYKNVVCPWCRLSADTIARRVDLARARNGKVKTVSAEIKASGDAKREKKRVDSGLRELTKLASRARKRLIKLVNKLGHASARRDALLDELTLLQEGIAAGVARFGRDTASKRKSGKTAR